MSANKTRRTRKHRHQDKQVLKFGRAAKPTHRLKSGRTGGVHAKKLKSQRGDNS